MGHTFFCEGLVLTSQTLRAMVTWLMRLWLVLIARLSQSAQALPKMNNSLLMPTMTNLRSPEQSFLLLHPLPVITLTTHQRSPVLLSQDVWIFCPSLQAPLLLALRKFPSGPSSLIAALRAGSTILSMKDQHKSFTNLLNMGMEASILPCHPAPSLHHISFPSAHSSLYAANGSPISTYGSSTRMLHLNGHLFFQESIHADIQDPIMGADVLCKHWLHIYVLATGCFFLLSPVWFSLFSGSPWWEYRLHILLFCISISRWLHLSLTLQALPLVSFIGYWVEDLLYSPILTVHCLRNSLLPVQSLRAYRSSALSALHAVSAPHPCLWHLKLTANGDNVATTDSVWHLFLIGIRFSISLI